MDQLTDVASLDKARSQGNISDAVGLLVLHALGAARALVRDSELVAKHKFYSSLFAFAEACAKCQ